MNPFVELGDYLTVRLANTKTSVRTDMQPSNYDLDPFLAVITSADRSVSLEDRDDRSNKRPTRLEAAPFS